MVDQFNKGEIKGKSFKLIFFPDNTAGVQIFNGEKWQLPVAVIDRITGEAKQLIEAEKEKAQQRSLELAAQLKAQREALDARLDEDGFILLAGEETAVVCRGTLRQCRDNIWKVQKLPRDYYTGKGCYVIVDTKTHEEVQSGEFDKVGFNGI